MAFRSMVTAASLAVFVPGWSQEPEVLKIEPENHAAGFLGVVVEDVPEAVRAQIPLSDGCGVSVLYVAAGSPAEGAGILKHDVLERFRGKLLSSPKALRALVRAEAPGKEIKVTLVRKGQTQDVAVVLGNAESLERRPAEISVPGRGMVRLDLGTIGLEEGDGRLEISALQKILSRSGLKIEGSVIESESIRASYRFALVGPEGTVELCERDGKQHLKIADPKGKLVYEGSYVAGDELELSGEWSKKLALLEQLCVGHR